MVKVFLGISTMGSHLPRAYDVVQSAPNFDGYYICHQLPKLSTPVTIDDCFSSKIRLIEMDTKGLSKSRNSILEQVPSPSILVPTDDDVLFLPNAKDVILDAFAKYPNADIITFRANKFDGTLFKNNYKNRPFWHNKLSIRSVSSIEIVVRSDSLKKLDITWDEKFGLGAQYGGGLEFTLLIDSLKRGLKILYYPESIVSHPEISSGHTFDGKKAYIRGAVAYRMYGFFGIFLSLYTTIRHRHRIRRHTTLNKYIGSFLKGFLDYRSEHKLTHLQK